MNANAKVMRIMVRNRQETGLLDVKMASYQHSYHTILHERFCLAVTSDVIKKKTACIVFCFAITAGTHLASATRVIHWHWHALDLAGLRADGMAGRCRASSSATRSSLIYGTLARSLSWGSLRYFH